MPTPDGSNNAHMARPTPASNDEKEAMNRALLKERPAELFDRLARENNVSRSETLLNRRRQRE